MNILRVLTGSRAHGLHDEGSDYDYRGVFAWPTSRLLSLGPKPKETMWIEGAPGKEDDTSWELGHFLHLAGHCNPSILEVFAAPIVEATDAGVELRALLPYVWEPKQVVTTFIGYGHNQRRKFLEGKDDRPSKYAVAYLRVLYQAYTLLKTNELVVDMRDTPVFSLLRRWKKGFYLRGEVIDETAEWEEKVRLAGDNSVYHGDIHRVNDFLLRFRRDHWE